jgi:hypothetical protein
VDGISPKLVTVMIGTNNSSGDTAEAIFAGIQAIVAELHPRLPEANIVVFSVFPRSHPRTKGAFEQVKAINQLLPAVRFTLTLELQKSVYGLEDGERREFVLGRTDPKTPVIALEVNKDGGPSRVYRAKWHNLEKMRRLIFVRDTHANEVGSVRVQVIENFYVPPHAD